MTKEGKEIYHIEWFQGHWVKLPHSGNSYKYLSASPSSMGTDESSACVSLDA